MLDFDQNNAFDLDSFDFHHFVDEIETGKNGLIENDEIGTIPDDLELL